MNAKAGYMSDVKQQEIYQQLPLPRDRVLTEKHWFEAEEPKLPLDDGKDYCVEPHPAHGEDLNPTSQGCPHALQVAISFQFAKKINDIECRR